MCFHIIYFLSFIFVHLPPLIVAITLYYNYKNGKKIIIIVNKIKNNKLQKLELGTILKIIESNVSILK